MSVNEPVTFLYAVTRKLTKKRIFCATLFILKIFWGGICGTLVHSEFSVFKFSIFKCISFG